MQVLADLKKHLLQKRFRRSEGLSLKILLQTIKIAGDRPPRYELRTFEASRLGGLSYRGRGVSRRGRARLPGAELNVSGLKFRADAHL